MAVLLDFIVTIVKKILKTNKRCKKILIKHNKNGYNTLSSEVLF